VKSPPVTSVLYFLSGEGRGGKGGGKKGREKSLPSILFLPLIQLSLPFHTKEKKGKGEKEKRKGRGGGKKGKEGKNCPVWSLSLLFLLRRPIEKKGKGRKRTRRRSTIFPLFLFLSQIGKEEERREKGKRKGERNTK